MCILDTYACMVYLRIQHCKHVMCNVSEQIPAHGNLWCFWGLRLSAERFKLCGFERDESAAGLRFAIASSGGHTDNSRSIERSFR